MIYFNQIVINKGNKFTVSFILIVVFTFISLTTLNSKIGISVEDEICDNALDDDGDGLVDFNDPDCDCLVIEPLSLIPNPSFEDTGCCPQLQNELDCATGWIQASYPTTDFIHTCGWLGWNNENDQFPPPQPFPDGNGIVGFRNGVYFPPGEGPNPMEYIQPNWKEYAGACLLSPMLADSSYVIEFDIGFVNQTVSPSILVTIFGTTDCSNLPFGGGADDPLTGCPTNATGWVELGNVPVVGGEDIWVQASIDILHDEDILAIAIGPDCSNNLNGHNRYYYLDNLLLDKSQSFQLSISTISNPCEADFALEVENQTNLTYQWYKDGIALINETSSKLSQMYGEGNYQVRTMNGSDCLLSGIYPFIIPVLSTTIYQSLCEGDVFQFGDQEITDSGYYVDTISSTNICDSVVYLELDIENQLVDSITTNIFEGEIFNIEDYSFSEPGTYLITLTTSNGCDIQTLLIIDFHKVYIPNVFSPNFDGINDYFTVKAKSGLIANIDMNIFDRWGNKVFNGTEWDGQMNNRSVNPGVYVYLIEVILNDTTSHLYSGSVTVVH